jgi:hypothetical protein
LSARYCRIAPDDRIGLAARPVAVDDDRHLRVGVELEEFGGELPLGKDIDGMDGIRQSHFLERDIDFDDVGATHRVKLDHRGLRILAARRPERHVPAAIAGQ